MTVLGAINLFDDSASVVWSAPLDGSNASDSSNDTASSRILKAGRGIRILFADAGQSIAGTRFGQGFSFGQTNLSNALFFGHFAVYNGRKAQWLSGLSASSDALRVYLADSANNWAAWSLGGFDDLPADIGGSTIGTWFGFQIDPASTPVATSGSLNLADVVRSDFTMLCGSSGQRMRMQLATFGYIQTIQVTGAESFSSISDYLWSISSGVSGVQVPAGTSFGRLENVLVAADSDINSLNFQAKKLTIGDGGATATTFNDDSGKLVFFGRDHFSRSTNGAELIINVGAGDSVDISKAVLRGLNDPLSLTVQQPAGTAQIRNALLFGNGGALNLTGGQLRGAVFDGFAPQTLAGTVLNSTSFDGTLIVDAAVTGTGSVEKLQINYNGGATTTLAVEIGGDLDLNPATAGSLTAQSLEETGVPTVDNLSAVATTLTVNSDFDHLVADPTTGGEALTVNQPQATLTVSGIPQVLNAILSVEDLTAGTPATHPTLSGGGATINVNPAHQYRLKADAPGYLMRSVVLSGAVPQFAFELPDFRALYESGTNRASQIAFDYGNLVAMISDALSKYPFADVFRTIEDYLATVLGITFDFPPVPVVVDLGNGTRNYLFLPYDTTNNQPNPLRIKPNPANTTDPELTDFVIIHEGSAAPLFTPFDFSGANGRMIRFQTDAVSAQATPTIQVAPQLFTGNGVKILVDETELDLTTQLPDYVLDSCLMPTVRSKDTLYAGHPITLPFTAKISGVTIPTDATVTAVLAKIAKKSEAVTAITNVVQASYNGTTAKWEAVFDATETAKLLTEPTDLGSALQYSAVEVQIVANGAPLPSMQLQVARSLA